MRSRALFWSFSRSVALKVLALGCEAYGDEFFRRRGSKVFKISGFDSRASVLLSPSVFFVLCVDVTAGRKSAGAAAMMKPSVPASRRFRRRLRGHSCSLRRSFRASRLGSGCSLGRESMSPLRHAHWLSARAPSPFCPMTDSKCNEPGQYVLASDRPLRRGRCQRDLAVLRLA